MKNIVPVTAIKKTRVKKGLSQETVSKEVGIKLSSFGGYERGVNPVPKDKAEKIAKVLGGSVGVFFKKHPKLTDRYLAK